MSKFIPLKDRIAIKRLPEEQKTSGGIIIPDTAKEKPMQGEVVAVGNGIRDDKGNLIPMEVKVGDIVLFAKWSGTEIKVDNTDLLVLKESDIIGIMK